MSFSREVRNQLAQLPVEKPCCRQSQLLALAVSAGVEARTSGANGMPHLHFTLDNAAVARHLFRLGKTLFGVAPVVDFATDRAPGKHPTYRVAIPVASSGMLPALLTADELQAALAKKACCRRSFLRGVFLGCGSLVSPSKAYHLEFNASEDVCAWIQDLLEKEGVGARCYRRSPNVEGFTAYVKDAEEIGTFLSLIGAHHALLQLEEVRIGKDLVNNVQRVVNCETANLSRTLRSADRQVKEIQWLTARGALGDCPPDWRAVAEARVEMPYASLQEIGESLSPPMSKSAVNHRLRLLHQAYGRNGGPAIAD